MIPSTKQSACSILPSYYSHLRSKILEFCMLKSTAFPIIHALSVASTNQNNYQDNVCIKYSEREYRAIASWHYLVYFDFWAKVYSEEGIYSVHLLKIWSEHGERRRWNSVFHQMPLLLCVSLHISGEIVLVNVNGKNYIAPYSFLLYLVCIQTNICIIFRTTYQDHWFDNFGNALIGHFCAQILIPLGRQHG